MNRARLLPALLALAGCTGSGSDVGPAFESESGTVLGGWVFAPGGAPVSSALVTVLGAPESAASDPCGRLRLEGPPTGPQILEFDGRRAAAVGSENLGRLRLATTIPSARTDLPAPVVLPDLDAGASRVVALGSLAGEADLDATGPGGTTLSLLLDPADGVHPAAVVAFADPAAHPGETTVRLTMVSFSPGDLPLPASAPENGRTLLAFVVDPPDVLFSPGASLRLPNNSGLPPGASLALRRLDFDTGTWVTVPVPGTVDSGGSAVEVWNGVTEGGLHALVDLAAPVEVFSGRVLDASLEPIQDAVVVAGDGSSGVTLPDGTFSFSAAAVPPDGPAVAAFPPSHFTAGRATASLASGLPAAFGDLVLRSRGGGLARALVVFRGEALAGASLGLGSDEANFGVTRFSDAEGRGEVIGAPSGRYFASVAFVQGDRVFRATRKFSVGEGGGISSVRIFPDKTRFKAHKVDGRVAVTVLREDSLAPIEDAFVMLGSDPTVTARRDRTNEFGRAVLEKAGKQPVTLTAGFVWTTNEGVLPTGPMGGRVAERRLTVYRTVTGVDSESIVMLLPVLAPVVPSFGRAGRIEGTAGGLTDPAVVPPSNPSGTYAVALDGHRAGGEADLWDVFGEGGLDDVQIPEGEDAVGFPPGGGTADLSYAVGAPEGSSVLVGVERDSADPDSGPMTRCGFLAGVPVQAGRRVSANLSLNLVPSETFSFSAPGLDPAALGSLRAIFAPLLPGSGGASTLVLVGDVTAGGTLDPVTGLGSVLLPPNAGPLAGATRLLRLDASVSAGAVSGSQSAFVRESTNDGFFPAVPVASIPTPGGADFDPEGIGVAWVPAVGARIQRLSVSRTEVVTEGLVDVERSFLWDVFIPGGASTFAFPPLPPQEEDIPVPPLFAPGATHDLTLEALALGITFPWSSFFAHRDAVRFSDYVPLGFSRFETTVTQP
ncbi:MAG: hypothetical protein L0323_03320 [Planctomycetes bacterium]|nr:hypothetical protein [Planctomycetota bacterium]